MVQNKSLIFAKAPEGLPVAGEHLKVEDRGFDLNAAPPKGGLVVKVLHVSFDPYMRGRMREAHVKSYMPAFALGEPIMSLSVAKVVKSDSSKFVEGDLLVAPITVAEYTTISPELVDASGIFSANKIDQSLGIDPWHFIGAAGMPGLTAYTSFYDIGKPKKGDTIFVSAASGAVGQMVGHLALHEGLKVIGSVGSDEKLEYIKKIGFEGFNYKKENPLEALKRLAPKGIEIYYDNVGGEQFDAALEVINDFGRIVACGQVSQYNLPKEEKYGVRNTDAFFSKQLEMRGFLVAFYGPEWYERFSKEVPKWIADGKIKPTQSFTNGIDNAPEGFIGMLEGKNFGKATLTIAKS